MDWRLSCDWNAPRGVRRGDPAEDGAPQGPAHQTPTLLPSPAYTPSARKERGCTLDPKGKTLEAGRGTLCTLRPRFPNCPPFAGANAPRISPQLACPIAPHSPPALKVRENAPLRFFSFFNFILKFLKLQRHQILPGTNNTCLKKKEGGGTTRKCASSYIIKNKRRLYRFFSPSSRV